MQSKIGIVLMNIGTPDSPSIPDVRQFLKEFLSDRYVIDLPLPLRYALLYGVILPFRSPKSAKAYQAIWTELGSPLLRHTQLQAQALQTLLGSQFIVTYAMRYGRPSIDSAITTLQTAGCQQTIVFPLYPQYTSSSTKTAIEHAKTQFQINWPEHSVSFIQSYYDHPHYIEALASTYRDAYIKSGAEHLIVSFHSLPLKAIRKTETRCETLCKQDKPCPISQRNVSCYRAQCYQTAHLMAESMNLSDTQYTVSFQSKVGRLAWTGPDTLEVFSRCRQRAYDNIAVVCPGFVSDCVETLEEINFRGRATWLTMGGNQFHYLPCLNQQATWIAAMKRIIEEHLIEL